MADRAPRLGANTVAINGAVSVAQIALTTLIALVTTRLMTNLLGLKGYGLLTALGASGVYSTIFLGGLVGASLRYLAFDVGRDDQNELSRTFASTVTLFAGVAIGLGALMFAMKPVIFGALTIPDEFRDEAAIVYWAAVSQLALGAFAAPFGALRQAHQRFAAMAAYSLGARALILVVLLFVSRGGPCAVDDSLSGCGDELADRLLLAGLLIAGANALNDIAVIGHTVFQYFSLMVGGIRRVSLTQMKRVLGFAQWSSLSALSMQLRSQIALLVFNIGFGPAANGAYAIADRTNNMSSQFSGGLHRALQAAITSAYSAGDHPKVRRIISVGSRYPAYAILPAYAVVMYDVEAVLRVWLDQDSALAASVTRLLLTASIMVMATNGYSLALYGLAKPRELLIQTIPFDIAAFAIGTIGILAFDAPTLFLPWMFAGNGILQVIIRPYIFGDTADFGPAEFRSSILAPILRVAGVVFTAVAVPHFLVDGDLLRVLSVMATAGITLIAAVWFFGSRPEERALAKSFVARYSDRLT